MKQEEKCKECGYLIVMGTCKCFPKVSEWEEEFDKICTGESKTEYGTVTWAVENSEMKLFIRSLIKDTEKRVAGEIKKEIEKIWNYPCGCDREQRICDHDFSILNIIKNIIKSKYE